VITLAAGEAGASTWAPPKTTGDTFRIYFLSDQVSKVLPCSPQARVSFEFGGILGEVQVSEKADLFGLQEFLEGSFRLESLSSLSVVEFAHQRIDEILYGEYTGVSSDGAVVRSRLPAGSFCIDTEGLAKHSFEHLEVKPKLNRLASPNTAARDNNQRKIHTEITPKGR
jgi:hypothetical protein